MNPITPATVPVTAANTILWSNGVPFTGFLLVGLALPNTAQGVQYATVNLYGVQPPIRIPTWTMIPISQGVISSGSTLFYSLQVEPPNTNYVFYWLDSNKKQIFPASGVNPALVTVASNPYVITPPVLTIPTAPSVIPVPQS